MPRRSRADRDYAGRLQNWRRRFRRVHVLGPDADAEQPRRDAAQHRKDAEELEEQRRLRPLVAGEHAADDPLLDGELQPLREAHRESAALLDRAQVVVRSTVPALSGAARRLAAATASCTARLMPTPPIGDIACAASPMQSRPGRHHCRSRSTVTLSSLTSSQLFNSPTRSARNGDISTTRCAERFEALRLRRARCRPSE